MLWELNQTLTQLLRLISWPTENSRRSAIESVRNFDLSIITSKSLSAKAKVNQDLLAEVSSSSTTLFITQRIIDR
ncbi:unnamed protein product [Schistosoma turkestanicum]|nr:unnamed protein product [Schistosoma turkestanicum]